MAVDFVDEVELAQANQLLEDILTLDLSQCGVEVCVASGDADAQTFEFRLIIQSPGLTQKFRDAIDVALKEHRQRVQEGNFELTRFTTEMVKPDEEIEYLNLMPYDTINRQVEPVEHYFDLPHFRHDERDFLKKMRFYVIRVQPPGKPVIYFYRRYSDSLMLSQSQFFAGWLQNDRYDSLDQPTFLFDRHIDCFSCDGRMFILQKNNFFQIFSFKAHGSLK